MLNHILCILGTLSVAYLVNATPPPQVRSNSLRLMQYNVEWLFLDYYKNMDCPGDGCTWHNKTEAIDHMNYVAAIINKFVPDIINLCEVEGINEVNALGALLSPEYTGYLIPGTDTATGQNVGLLSNIPPVAPLTRSTATRAYPVAGSACGIDESQGGHASVSKHSVALFDWNGIRAAVISVHLIAYPTDPERCAKREAQALVIADLVEQHIADGYEVVVMGDFNDYDGDVIDENDSHPTSNVLATVKGNVLTNVAYKIPQQYRGTNWWDKNGVCEATGNEFVMIDHVLVTAGLLDRVESVGVYQGYTEYCGKMNSDHYPVIVNIRLD